jgi:hypothetical protein
VGNLNEYDIWYGVKVCVYVDWKFVFGLNRCNLSCAQCCCIVVNY